MSNYERTVAARRTFADEHIEQWADVYLANPHLARRGLLQEQLDVRRRVDLDAALQEMGERAIAALAAESHCANGTWCEKLRHRAWPQRRQMNRKLMEVSGGN